MQTFLPYPDFVKTVKCLDYRRLGKQRVEAYQILKVLLEGTEVSAWRNHPANLMWKGFEPALASYGAHCCTEWTHRRYIDNLFPYFSNVILKDLFTPIQLPPWFGDEAFHASHRSNLLRKDFAYYSKFGWTEPVNLPYVWPVRKVQK